MEEQSLLNMPSQLIPAHLDGWYNVITGMGIKGLDKRLSNQFSMGRKLDDATLIDIYRADGLGKKIITTPVGDMVRRWFYIQEDQNHTIIKYLAEKNAKKYIKSGLKWGDLFGGAIVFMGIDDGQPADKPVKEDQIEDIVFFETYDRRNITWFPEDLYKDPKKAKYGKPEIYTITNPTTGLPFRVHDSRILRFNGEELPAQEEADNLGWGDSKLQAIFDRLSGLGDSLGGVECINTEFIMGVLKVSNLQQLLSNPQGEKALQDRMKAMDLIKSILNTIVIDKTEEFERVTSIGVSGLKELIDILIDVVCGISGIPRVKLIGDQSKGIGGGAEGNIRLYYDDISSRQEEELTPELNKLVRYAAKAKACNYKKDPSDGKNLTIVYNELWQPSEKEVAETRLINAKSDVSYMEYGLPPEYVFYNRFGGQAYGKEIVLPREYVEKIAKMSAMEAVRRSEESLLKNKEEDDDDDEDNNNEKK